MIVDAHHHLWDRHRFRYGWLAQVPAIERDFLVSDYEESIAGANIVKSVFVQADVDAEFALQEARWALSIAEAESPVQAVVAWAPVERPELGKYLDELGAHDKLKGVRRLIQGEADPDFCARPEFVEGVRSLAARGLSFDLCLYPPQLPAAARLASQVPEVDFVLDHMGKPDIRGGQLRAWREPLQQLAELPNVYCKISGLVTEADVEHWRAEDLRPYIDVAIAAFGYERLMFGSDWPVCLLGVEYRRWLEVVEEAVAPATASERRQLFSDTATRFYRL